MIKNITFIIIIIFTIFIFSVVPVLASVGQNVQYQIILPETKKEKILGEKQTKNQKQIEAEAYQKNGYLVRQGFANISSAVPFSFSISDLTIDFGILSPGVPATQSNRLTIATGSLGGYQIAALENHPLKLDQDSDVTIPNTPCDSKNCNEQKAEAWINNSSYGFGFHPSGNNTPSDFIGKNYYRQFADLEKGEKPQIISDETFTSNNPPSQTKTITIVYKTNISKQQKAGRYENEITFIALPKY